MRKIALLCCAALALALAAPPARAVVTGTTTEVSFTGNGSTTVYPFSFKATDKAWVKVYLGEVAQVSGFTVALNTNQDAAPGGSVTFAAAPGSGVAVRLERVIPLTQPTALLDGARFAPKVIEHGLDLPVLQTQQVDQRAAKAETTHATDKAAQAAKDSAQDALIVDTRNMASVGIGDATTVLAKGSTTARPLRDRWSDVVNVKDFGAAGDGTSDDTAAIQRAIDSTPCTIVPPWGKPSACGGTVYFPVGRYKVTSTITLKRGIRIVGASREGSQIVSYGTGSVLKYADALVYVPDEIGVENISVLQDPLTTAASGAGIEVNGGTASPQSVTLRLSNVTVEGTYYGLLLSAAIGASIRDSTFSRCVSHGVYVKWDAATPAYAAQSTSSAFQNSYAYFNGGDGWRLEATAYVSLTSCASDSNGRYGYSIDNAISTSLISSGAEGNALAGVYLKDAQQTTLSVEVVHSGAAATKHGVIVENSTGTVILGGFFTAIVPVTGYGVNVTVTRGPVLLIGCQFVGAYAGANRTNVGAVVTEIGGDVTNTVGLSLSPDSRLSFGSGANDYFYGGSGYIHTPGGILAGGYVAAQVFQLGTGPVFRAGPGSPEGFQVGVRGDVYHRTDGASGSTLYVKEVGTGNTGWRAMPAQAAAQADSSAADVATLKNDFNALLAKLRTAAVLAP